MRNKIEEMPKITVLSRVAVVHKDDERTLRVIRNE